MHTPRARRFAALLVASAVLGTAPLVAQTQLYYDVVDVSPAGSKLVTEALAIDAQGHVAGDTGDTLPTNGRGWVRDEGGERTLQNLPGANFSSPTALFANGRTIGVSGVDGNHFRGVVWAPTGAPLELRPVDGATLTVPYDSNGRNMIVGFSSTLPGARDEPTLWRNGVLSKLPVPPGLSFGRAQAVDNQGNIGGYAWDASFTQQFGYILHPSGTFEVIPPVAGGQLSVLLDLNDSGQAIGLSNVGQNLVAIRYENGVSTNLGTFGTEPQSILLAINRSGQAVGLTQGGATNVPLVTDGNLLVDLNTVIDPFLNWTILAAFDINNAGQIAGIGIAPTGALRAVRLDPTLPPQVAPPAGSAAPRQRRPARLPEHLRRWVDLRVGPLLL